MTLASRAGLALLAGIALLSCATTSLPKHARAAEESEKVREMSDSYMPFELRPDADLSKAEIFYTFISPKAGAGRQEVTIGGDGKVTLFHSRSSDDKQPTIREGRLDPAVVLRLLDFIDGRSFLRLEDHYPPEEEGCQAARRVVRVRAPGVLKEVTVQREGVDAFEQVVAGVLFSASLALPEAINGRLFPNL